MTSIDFKTNKLENFMCLNLPRFSSRANVGRFETRLQDWENSTNFG